MRLLQKLSTINKPLEITFKDMVKLMNQCDIVEKQNEINRQPHLSKEQRSVDGAGTSLFPQNPFSLLSGIVPGMCTLQRLFNLIALMFIENL